MENNFTEFENSNVGYTQDSMEKFTEQLNVEDEMLKAFIGKNAKDFLKSKLNWVAAVIGQSVGPAWFFYRRCHLFGWAFIILTFIVGGIASELGIDKAYYIMFFIYLFSATPLYLWHAKRKVTKIINDNTGADLETLKAIAAKKGGTSTVAVVVYGIVFFIIVALLIALWTWFFMVIFEYMY